MKEIFRLTNINKFCSVCNKPHIFCKKMCNACYSKAYRNTTIGKEKMKAYNLSGGKEAHKRYRERLRLNKPPKPPKQNCECGRPSVAKNLCMACYQRKRYVKKESSIKNKLDYTKIFNSVLFYVNNGYTILNACKKAGLKSSSTLYRTITPLQKKELSALKKIRNLDRDFDDDYL